MFCLFLFFPKDWGKMNPSGSQFMFMCWWVWAIGWSTCSGADSPGRRWDPLGIAQTGRFLKIRSSIPQFSQNPGRLARKIKGD